MKNSEDDKVQRNEKLPGGLRDTPRGSIQVELPPTGKKREESRRDMARIITGGGVFEVGKGKLVPVLPAADVASGDLSMEACEAHIQMLSSIIRDEVQAAKVQQQFRMSKVLNVVSRMSCSIDTDAIDELICQIAAHISVSPGMQLVLSKSLPPALWQPFFAVCVGSGQVRVITVAFVGQPVSGTGPSSKRTPFFIRLVTEDVMAMVVETLRCGQRPGSVPVYFQGFACAEADQTSLDCFVGQEEELFKAIGSGDWCRQTGVRPTSVIVRRISSLSNLIKRISSMSTDTSRSSKNSSSS